MYEVDGVWYLVFELKVIPMDDEFHSKDEFNQDRSTVRGRRLAGGMLIH
jgi:hypothetical protein